MSSGNFDTSAFLREYWRRKPCLLRGFIGESSREKYTTERFLSWCVPPVVARLFIRTEELAPGTARAALLPDAEEASKLFSYFRDRGDALTLLLNETQMVEPDMGSIRDSFNIPYIWREDNTVATLSTPSSGIGFHAGHEDGFIVQLRGSRYWRLWEPNCLNHEYRLKILGDPTRQDVCSPSRPEVPASFECELRAGDVLFVPALMGHEGVTLEESISLSIAWRGITPYQILSASIEAVSEAGLEVIRKHPERFFTLLPDPPAAGVDPITFLIEAMASPLELLGNETPTEDTLRAGARSLIAAL